MGRSHLPQIYALYYQCTWPGGIFRLNTIRFPYVLARRARVALFYLLRSSVSDGCTTALESNYSIRLLPDLVTRRVKIYGSLRQQLSSLLSFWRFQPWGTFNLLIRLITIATVVRWKWRTLTIPTSEHLVVESQHNVPILLLIKILTDVRNSQSVGIILVLAADGELHITHTY